VGDDGTEGVEKKTFNWVVVECTEGKWDIEPVVDGVEVSVEESRGVEETVQEVLPCVDEEAAMLVGRDHVRRLTMQRRTEQWEFPTSRPIGRYRHRRTAATARPYAFQAKQSLFS
jgi:hypothetical protein